MKVNAPEKIYIPTILAANTVKYKEEGSIEYTRTDAFIEKAKKWFEIQNEGVDEAGNYKCDMTDFEDFEKFIKGE